MPSYKDQHGNIVTLDQLVQQVSEAVLINIMALAAAGIQRKDIKMIVGPDGGTIIAKGVLFQTPILKKLNENEGRILFETFKDLLTQYDEGNIDESHIAEMQARNDYDHKCSVMRKKFGSSN